jgi:hypothetical protein
MNQINEANTILKLVMSKCIHDINVVITRY